MFSRLVSPEDAVYLLNLKSRGALDDAIAAGSVQPAPGPKEQRFRVEDLVLYKLARVFEEIGVEKRKASRYADAVLTPRLQEHESTATDWIEDEAQELFCLISDNQLARIFLRNREDLKEIDVGAVKPVLLPTRTCEINVFRVIRPVVYRARQMFGEKRPERP